MTNLTHSLLFFSCSLSLLVCVAIAGSRPAHGPAYLNPSAFSPEAYDFFHPKSSLPDNNSPRNSHSLPFLSPSPSPSPSMASNVEADTQGSKVSSDERISESRREEGRGETVGLVLGISFTALLLMGIYFVIKKRLANITRTISLFHTSSSDSRTKVAFSVPPRRSLNFLLLSPPLHLSLDDEDLSFLDEAPECRAQAFTLEGEPSVVSGEDSTEKVSPAPSPVNHYSYPPQSETGMSPSHSPSDAPTAMPPGYSYHPPEASDLNHNDGRGRERESSSGGGKKAGIAVGAIAAASMVGLGGYVLKKRRENIRRSRYEYAATEIF
ncbi:hypothetical protein F2Q70_00007758 [Brassica cretica]|uniref:Uncharacterized protein n=1 Tax=Brassica cretica TaxID=69181 RepID=A0A8S9MDU3_BRACR|nr:hypothetical protein F2Q70_00007758 [Brassica cretica]